MKDLNGFFPFGTVALLTLDALLIDQTHLQWNMLLRMPEQTKKVEARAVVSLSERFILVAMMTLGFFKGGSCFNSIHLLNLQPAS